MTKLQKFENDVLRHHKAAKTAHPDALVGIRYGDFYEFYGIDAQWLAKELRVTLTGRRIGCDDSDSELFRLDMVGFPAHSIDKYLLKMLERDRSVALVAICEVDQCPS